MQERIYRNKKKSHVGRGKSESQEEKSDKGGKKSISRVKSRHGAGLTEKKKNATLQFGMLVFK